MRFLPFQVLLWSLLTLPPISVGASPAVRDRISEAQREVVLAESSYRRAAARLEELQRNPEATTEQILAAETVVHELSELVAVRKETLRDLEALAEETVTSPDSTVTEGMEAFESAVGEVAEAEEPETEQERLDREFAASLEEFDSVILDHHRKVEDKMAERSAAGEAKASTHRTAAAEAEALLRSMGVETGEGQEGSTTETAGQASGGEQAQGSQGRDPEVAGGTSSGEGTPGGGGSRAPREDEDVVARQLREAAEKETDPVLREKLWKEYEAYLEGRS